MTTLDETRLLRRIRLMLVLFMIVLVLSGATAFALPWEVQLLCEWFGAGTAAGDALPEHVGQVASLPESRQVGNLPHTSCACRRTTLQVVRWASWKLALRQAVRRH